jgi:beta-lactamase superfamily II metal-dependent hydrolase
MFRQGLGDCFLLTFPKADGSKAHVMIDCGVVLGTTKPEVVMKKVVQSLRAETSVGERAEIDVLVITHEHWDHLSAFTVKQAQAEFAGIDFGQLWLAWTEDPKNALANALRSERELKKKAAAETRKKLKTRKAADGRLKRLDALMEFFGVTAGGDGADGGAGVGGTAAALSFLKDKVKKKCMLNPGEFAPTIPGVDGVRIYVLGPPQDKEKLHKTLPSKGDGYGLTGGEMSLTGAFAAALGVGENRRDRERSQPFPHAYRRRMGALPAVSPYQKKSEAWRRIDDDWLAVGERLALQLDNDTNNTSLVLAFELIDSGDVLLFVGDAQAGNWLSWESLKWKVKENGQTREVTALDLLSRAVFYKVGHHGSHNATLRAKGLELMVHPELVAMLPVDEKVAHDVKGWTHMPLVALCDRLKEKCAAVVRIDRMKSSATPTRVWGSIPTTESFSSTITSERPRGECLRKAPV